jgi:hypothetical protein
LVVVVLAVLATQMALMKPVATEAILCFHQPLQLVAAAAVVITMLQMRQEKMEVLAAAVRLKQMLLTQVVEQELLDKEAMAVLVETKMLEAVVVVLQQPDKMQMELVMELAVMVETELRLALLVHL